MKIETVQISNWRSIKNLSIKFQDLMVFIGQNNHGKSNILSALLFFFGEIKHQDLDFNKGSQELHVEISFNGLDESDKTTFRKYLTSDNKIRVRKSAYISGSFEYHGYIENPAEEYLQESNAASFAKREIAETLPFHPFLPATGRLSKQDIIDAQIQYINQNREGIVFSYELEESNFLGLKSVAKGIFGNVYFIPAIKDASEDFSSKESSAFGKLFSGIIQSMSDNNSDWKDTKEKLVSLFGSLNLHDENGQHNPSRPAELSSFEELISLELESWGARINVEISPPNIDDVFKANTQVWVDDGVRTDIRRKGHGLQRAMVFALIKVLSNQSTPEDQASSSRSASDSSYFILEEPELYLHPQAQRAMFDSLIDLSNSNNQVALCTHSSALISVENYKSICMVRKESEIVGTEIRQCTEDIFTGDKKKDFSLSYWINPDRSELFFAKRVLLVEGQTEKIIIPRLAKKLDIFKHEYTLVDCGSKANIPLYCLLLNKFNIPYIAIYDKDHQTRKSEQDLNVADKSSQDIENAIDQNLGSSIVFVNDIEEEIGYEASGKNKPFTSLVYIEDTSYKIPDNLTSKIQAIYS
jgi:CRISPR-associated exonuclease Cas4